MIIQKPHNWDSVEGREFGEFKELPPGGHPCIIKDATVKFSKGTNKEMLVLQIDVASGEYANFFSALPENMQHQARINQLTENVELFKGLIEAVEASNDGFRWDFDTRSLMGKRCCGVFGREQYLDKNGKPRFSTRVLRITSLAKLQAGEVAIPKDKLLEGFSGNHGQSHTSNRDNPFEIDPTIDDDTLPF